jgi:hypothetical protein
MSTRSLIARVGVHEGQFRGRYVHADGYPTGMGSTLWTALHGHFKNNLSAMLAYLIDAPHAVCGWSAIVGKNFSLKPGYTWQKATADGAKYEVYSKHPNYMRPQCFAGRPGEEPYTFTEKNLEGGTDIEWLYIFDEVERKLFVRDVSAKEDVAIIDLNGDEPDWSEVECGENFERCSHYAWAHGLLPKTSNLSTQTWLGNRPLEFRDAIAFLVGGKRYKATGSGGDAEFMNRCTAHPKGPWVATVVAGNGCRRDIPVAARTSNGEYLPLSGVTWIYPPTKNTHGRETKVWSAK